MAAPKKPRIAKSASARSNVTAPVQPASQPAPQVVRVSVSLQASDDTPSIYINYAEVAQSVNEFSIFGAKVPGKFSKERVEDLQDTGILEVDALIELVVPPALIPGLIRALIVQKDGYEAQYGSIPDPEKPNG